MHSAFVHLTWFTSFRRSASSLWTCPQVAFWNDGANRYPFFLFAPITLVASASLNGLPEGFLISLAPASLMSELGLSFLRCAQLPPLLVECFIFQILSFPWLPFFSEQNQS